MRLWVEISVPKFQLLLLELNGTARRQPNLYHSAQQRSLAGVVRITQVRRCLLCHAEYFTADFAIFLLCNKTAGSQHVATQDNRYRPTRHNFKPTFMHYDTAQQHLRPLIFLVTNHLYSSFAGYSHATGQAIPLLMTLSELNVVCLLLSPIQANVSSTIHFI